MNEENAAFRVAGRYATATTLQLSIYNVVEKCFHDLWNQH